MGISSLGWLHTLGSLPAIPLAIVMLFRHGRIVPTTRAGLAYFGFMLLGVLTVFPIAHQAVSTVIAAVTLVALLVGFGVSRWASATRWGPYVETVALSLSVFLLFLPAVSETLRRLPAGDPIAKSMTDPLLVGVQGALLLALVIGVPLQLRAVYLRRRAPGRMNA